MATATRPTLDGLHHVKLPVTNLARSRAWYERVLSSKGLEREDELIPEMTSFPAELGFREHVEWCCGVYEALQRDAFLIGADRAR